MGCVDGLVSVYTSPVLLEVFSDLENGELEIAPMLRRRRTNPTTTRTYDSQNLVDEKEQEWTRLSRGVVIVLVLGTAQYNAEELPQRWETGLFPKTLVHSLTQAHRHTETGIFILPSTFCRSSRPGGRPVFGQPMWGNLEQESDLVGTPTSMSTTTTTTINQPPSSWTPHSSPHHKGHHTHRFGGFWAGISIPCRNDIRLRSLWMLLRIKETTIIILNFSTGNYVLVQTCVLFCRENFLTPQYHRIHLNKRLKEYQSNNCFAPLLWCICCFKTNCIAKLLLDGWREAAPTNCLHPILSLELDPWINGCPLLTRGPWGRAQLSWWTEESSWRKEKCGQFLFLFIDNDGSTTSSGVESYRPCSYPIIIRSLIGEVKLPPWRISHQRYSIPFADEITPNIPDNPWPRYDSY